MQHVTSDSTLQKIQRGLLDEIDDSKKRIHPAHAKTFNGSMQNRIDLAKQILWLMECDVTVEELLYLIDCRIEGEKVVLSYCSSIALAQVHCDHHCSTVSLSNLHKSKNLRYRIHIILGYYMFLS